MSPVPVPLFMAPEYPRAAGHSTALASRVPSVSPDRYNTVCEKPISSTNPLALGWTWLGMAANKAGRALEPLRILVADGKGQRLEEVTRTVTGLGHDLVGLASLSDIAPLTASLRPDAAIVIVGESSEHALDLIGKIVTEAACPVIAILDVEDEAFISRAAKRGIFAYITKARDGAALQSSLDVVLSRFAEYHGLEGAFSRRAITERAKGILRCSATRRAARTASSSRLRRRSH